MQAAAEAAAGGAGVTVEEYLTAYTERLIAGIDARTEAQISVFRAEFDRAISHATGAQAGMMGAAASASCDGTAKSRDIEPLGIYDVHLSCVDGPYSGRKWKLKPRLGGKPIMVGRSTGRKFTRGGVSLSKDGEVSTTHGNFTVAEVLRGVADLELGSEGTVEAEEDSARKKSGGEGRKRSSSCSSSAAGGSSGWHGVMYTDLGSTNGTFLNGASEQIEGDIPVLLAQDGDSLHIGANLFEVQLARVGTYTNAE